MSTTAENGSTTAETAIVLPVLVGLAATLVWLVGVGIAQVRCVDTARDAARALARGEPRAAVVASAEEMAPPGAEVVIRRRGEVVEVRVKLTATPPGSWFDTVSIPVGSVARLPTESSPTGSGEGRW